MNQQKQPVQYVEFYRQQWPSACTVVFIQRGSKRRYEYISPASIRRLQRIVHDRWPVMYCTPHYETNRLISFSNPRYHGPTWAMTKDDWHQEEAMISM